MTVYAYTLADFAAAAGTPDLHTLRSEIESVILVPFNGASVKIKSSYCGLIFDGDLSAGDLIALDAVVTAHTGAPPPPGDLDPGYQLRAYISGTSTSPGGGVGNADIINLPRLRVIIPNVSGTGARNVDLGTASPVPAGGDGYWDVNQTSGVITPSATPGAAAWHLIDVDVVLEQWRGIPHDRWNIVLSIPQRRFRISAWLKKNDGS